MSFVNTFFFLMGSISIGARLKFQHGVWLRYIYPEHLMKIFVYFIMASKNQSNTLSITSNRYVFSWIPVSISDDGPIDVTGTSEELWPVVDQFT